MLGEHLPRVTPSTTARWTNKQIYSSTGEKETRAQEEKKRATLTVNVLSVLSQPVDDCWRRMCAGIEIKGKVIVQTNSNIMNG